jgi:predicted S18 family serine protease
MRKQVFFAILLFIIINNAAGYKQILYGDYNPEFFTKYIDMPVVAVSPDEKTGVAGWLRIAFIEGNGNNIVFDERTTVDPTTIESALNAIDFAESYLNERHDYFLSYDLRTEKVSGGSTGSAIAAGIIALSENRGIIRNTLITGAVDYGGNMIETGGMPLKTAVAGASGYKSMIVPGNSSQYTLIEKHIAGNSIYYVSKQLNMIDYAREAYNLELSECANLRHCLGRILQ